MVPNNDKIAIYVFKSLQTLRNNPICDPEYYGEISLKSKWMQTENKRKQPLVTTIMKGVWLLN